MVSYKKIFGLLTLFLGLTLIMYDVSTGQKLSDETINIEKSQVTGTVMDALTQKTISNAVVKVPSANKKAKTDERGDFSFNIQPGSYKVIANHDGYKSSSKSIKVKGQSKKLLIKLEPKSQ